MAKSPNWTQQEIEVLTSNYPILGNSEALTLMFKNRSPKGIQVKASRLGLKYANAFNILKTTEQYSLEISPQGVLVLDAYINDATKIKHQCTFCSHIWSSKPNNILNGSGCPICNKGFGSRYSKEDRYPENAYIYLIKILTKEEHFLKLGITAIPTNRRIWQIKYELGSELISCDIIKKVKAAGKFISVLEGIILSNPTLIRYNTNLKFKGRTELFNISEEDALVETLNLYLYS